MSTQSRGETNQFGAGSPRRQQLRDARPVPTLLRFARYLFAGCLSLFIICLSLATAEAQQTAFTYQGRLTDGGSAATGNYDLQFSLFDSPTDGAQIGTTQTLPGVSVSAGIFTVSLDFGANAFTGATRYMEIGARSSGVGTFNRLTPRQPISSIPYAVRSLSAATAEVATNAQQLAGVAANQYVQGSDARLSDSRTPTAGSSNYIQNSINTQSTANFNISGNGTAAGTLSANQVNSVTQYNLNGTRVFTVNGAGDGPTSNTFAGAGAGASTTPTNTGGKYNSFFGSDAGAANTTGSSNAFFGMSSGLQNTIGTSNSFYGMRSGSKNTTGSLNSFFGAVAGDQNLTGNFNAFFGASAGRANTTGATNSFFGSSAGSNNISGSNNTFVGPCAGCANGFGSHNSFFGENAGTSNLSEDYNTFIGANANGAPGAANSTAIGAFAKVTESNTVVLGSINGVNGATADTKVGIGTTGPVFKLQVSDAANTGLRVQNFSAGGTVGSFGFLGDFNIDSSTLAGGRLAVKENGNVGVGTNNPLAKLDINGKVRTQSLGFGGSIQLCLNSAAEISNCSSSRRYKTAFRPFTSGLNLINQLHPIAFRWKADQALDLGLGAEDVAAVEPLLVTHNANGEVEGVKYDRLSAVFINAFKEQQTQIERQQAQIKAQENQIKAQDKALVGLSTRVASLEATMRHPRPRQRKTFQSRR